MSAFIDELKRTLPHMPFFGGLDEQALESVINMLTERTYDRDHIVFREGEFGRSMYIIQSGTLVASRDGQSGHKIRLLRYGPCDFFGDMELIEVQPRSMTVTTETPVRLFELTNMNLYKLYKSDLRAYVMVLQNMSREMCRRLRRADRRIVQMADEKGDEVTQIRDASQFRFLGDPPDGSEHH